MIYTLRCQMVAPVSMRDAFAVFQDPFTLARITPPWLGFRVVTSDPVMRKDALLDYEFRWLHVPLRWRTAITEYEPPFFFTDEMVKGPYALWRHKHTFHPTVEGTLVTDEVDYALPLGWLGRTVHRVLLAEQLKSIFRYRQVRLNGILAGGKAHWTDPAVTEKLSPPEPAITRR